MLKNKSAYKLEWLLFTGSIVCFLSGLYWPLFSSKTQVVGLVMGYDEVTLFSSIDFMYQRGEWFLALIIFLFTFCLPIIKYVDLFFKLSAPHFLSKRLQQFLAMLDKWSMLDVFIVAQIIVVFKFSSHFVLINTGLATYALAASIVLRMILAQLLAHKIPAVSQ